MRIAIAWSNISGYMAACWRSLSQVPGVELKVWAFAPKPKANQAPFDPQQTLAGIDGVLLSEQDRSEPERLASQVTAFKPDVLLVPGWIDRSYVALASDPRLRQVHKIMGLDMPWLGDARQRAACITKRRYVRQFDTLWVAGERSYQYARRLAGTDARIRRGVYAYDAETFDPVGAARPADAAAWPRRFLYVGRYVPVKGLDVMLAAYRRYRERVSQPWELHCCGTGPLAHLLAGQPGVTDHGFTQPGDLPARFAEAGAFVLASRYEPWGVVVAEALGGGLPVLASSACGAAVELVHPLHNGLITPAGDVEALADAMIWLHVHIDQLPRWSQHAQECASAYNADRWAQRLLAMPRLTTLWGEGANHASCSD